jgi:hypothetical protein
MKPAIQPPPSRTPFPWLALVPAVIALLCVGAYVELRLRSAVITMEETVRRQGETIDRLEAAVQLFRIEQSSEGQGVEALLEKLAEFAPHMQAQSALTYEYQPRMEEILRAFGALGSESFPKILAAYRNSEKNEEDELRKWLLSAAVRVDPDRAEGFLVKVLRGLDPTHVSLAITPRNRANAAQELVSLDKERHSQVAGEVLAEIFSYESVRGVNPAKVPHHLRGQVPDVGMDSSGFDLLLNWFLATEYPDKEVVLIQILNGPEHKLITKQTCVKELGELGSRPAADSIRKLYLNDPDAQGNPIFLNYCLDSLGMILRSEACEFFREQQREVKNELVLENLRTLLLEYC